MASDSERVWGRPSAREGQSVVWSHYDIELPEKNFVKCKKCPNKIFKYSGSTRCMWYRTRMSSGIIDDLFILRGHFAPFAEERKKERMAMRKKYTKKKK